MSGKSNLKRIGVMTGGGDCPGLNAVIRAVTKTAINVYNVEVYGIYDGFLGLIQDHVKPLTFDDVSNILDRGGTILGSSNKSNPEKFVVGKDESGKPVYENVTDTCLANIDKYELDAIVCIGGDGTMSGAHNFVERGVRIVGVPKTIDNDLMHTEITFGFDTAVATATQAMDRIRTTASSHHRVMLVEMMGRNAGWLTLHSATAAGADIILIPEIPFEINKITEYCTKRHEKGRAYTIVAVAEGAKPVGGDVVVDRIVHESPDPIRLGGVSEVVSEQLSTITGLESRATVLGHTQRGGTPTAFDRVIATQFGHHALELLMSGEDGVMVAMQHGRVTHTPIAEVADKQRTVPEDNPLIAAAQATGASFGV